MRIFNAITFGAVLGILFILTVFAGCGKGDSSSSNSRNSRVCDCLEKEHLGIGEYCGCGTDCDCTLKAYSILVNGVKIYREGNQILI